MDAGRAVALSLARIMTGASQTSAARVSLSDEPIVQTGGVTALVTGRFPASPHDAVNRTKATINSADGVGARVQEGGSRAPEVKSLKTCFDLLHEPAPSDGTRTTEAE